jgi:pilus assembly protein CpaB
MNRRQGWMLLSLGIILALGTGALVFVLLQQQQRELASEAQRLADLQGAPPVATMELPVAARPLMPGAVITSEDVLLKPFPLDLVPVAAITDAIDLESQILIAPIGQGETFSTTKLAGSVEGAVSQQLAAGRVIFAYPVEDLLTQVDIVTDGDHIDLLITLALPTTGPATTAEPGAEAEPAPTSNVTAYTLQNIEVFKVLRPGGDLEQLPLALLLSVTPEDAVVLKHLKDSGGKIDFVLRPMVDKEPVDLPSVDIEDIIVRFGLR